MCNLGWMMPVLQKWHAGCVSPSVGSVAQIKSSGVIQWNEMELEKVSPWHWFSLSSNVIRAHNEGHGFDYNPPASLYLSFHPFSHPSPSPSLFDLFAPFLPITDLSSIPSFSPNQSPCLALNLTCLMYWDSTPLFLLHALVCSLVSLALPPLGKMALHFGDWWQRTIIIGQMWGKSQHD